MTSHQMFFFCWIRRNRKSGPPTRDVITPTGRPPMVRFLARQSAARRIMAPDMADAGIRYLLSEPSEASDRI